jgi:hypothetical protein
VHLSKLNPEVRIWDRGRWPLLGFLSIVVVACDVDTFGTMEPGVGTPSDEAGAASPPARAPVPPLVGEEGADSGNADSPSPQAPQVPDAAPVGTSPPAEGGSTSPPTPALGCPTDTVRCPTTGTCVSDCAKSCPVSPIACFGCATGGRDVVVAICVPALTPTACLTAPRERCACAEGKASLCPGKSQVCVGTLCTACGEPGSDGLACRESQDKTCENSGKGKPDKQFICK